DPLIVAPTAAFHKALDPFRKVLLTHPSTLLSFAVLHTPQQVSNTTVASAGADCRGASATAARGGGPGAADAPSVRRRMGLMRGMNIGGAGRRGLWGGGVGLLLLACAAFLPRSAYAESVDYAPAYPQLPIPLGSTRPEDGGPFTFTQFVSYR